MLVVPCVFPQPAPFHQSVQGILLPPPVPSFLPLGLPPTIPPLPPGYDGSIVSDRGVANGIPLLMLMTPNVSRHVHALLIFVAVTEAFFYALFLSLYMMMIMDVGGPNCSLRWLLGHTHQTAC